MKKVYAAILVVAVLTAQPSISAVSQQEAERLDTVLTPMGAERAGNAAGTIPAWEGGLSKVPAGISFTPGGHHPDPYAADQPLFTITAATMAQYDGQLTEGHKALLRAYPDSFQMKIYPSRRSCAYPDYVYQAVRRNAVNAQLTDDGHGVTGAVIASPFPIPQSAREVLWNHELAFRGYKMMRESAEAAPTKNGDFSILVSQDQWIYTYADPALSKTEDAQNVYFRFLKVGISPPGIAGSVLGMHNTINQMQEVARIWVYRPGERKVKRLSTVGYDSPDPESEGVRTSDNFQVFNGAADRYDWELQGKQEKFIPYNTYRLASPDLQYKDIIGKGHLNSDVMRYELHRVWAVEARLKPGQQHSIAARRLLYMDEDSWIPAAAALYDDAGALSRVQEGHIFPYYDQPLCAIGSDIVFDISGGRYHVMGLRNQQQGVKFNLELDPETFTPGGMRRMGVR